jgi:hypothetical protein
MPKCKNCKEWTSGYYNENYCFSCYNKEMQKGGGKVSNKTKKCNEDHKPTHVLGAGYEFWAATGSRLSAYLPKFDLCLNCTGSPVSKPKHSIPFEWGKDIEIPQFKEIILDWWDQRGIWIDPEFWVKLLRHAIETQSKVLVFCVGGHGRTGTAICALQIAGGATAKQAIEKIRADYCPSAVESDLQVAYLEELEAYYRAKREKEAQCLYSGT